jgi:hypothetical protein
VRSFTHTRSSGVLPFFEMYKYNLLYQTDIYSQVVMSNYSKFLMNS